MPPMQCRHSTIRDSSVEGKVYESWPRVEQRSKSKKPCWRKSWRGPKIRMTAPTARKSPIGLVDCDIAKVASTKRPNLMRPHFTGKSGRWPNCGRVFSKARHCWKHFDSKT